MLGFSAILLEQLGREIVLSQDEASWIAALSNIGQLFGAIGTGILAGKFGRRPTLMLLCVPLLAGWVTLGLARDQMWMFYLGRILQGLGVMSSVTQVIYFCCKTFAKAPGRYTLLRLPTQTIEECLAQVEPSQSVSVLL